MVLVMGNPTEIWKWVSDFPPLVLQWVGELGVDAEAWICRGHQQISCLELALGFKSFAGQAFQLFFFPAQTKMSGHSPLTLQYSR